MYNDNVMHLYRETCKKNSGFHVTYKMEACIRSLAIYEVLNVDFAAPVHFLRIRNRVKTLLLMYFVGNGYV